MLCAALICIVPIVWGLNPGGLRRFVIMDQLLALELCLSLAFFFLSSAAAAKTQWNWLTHVVLGTATLVVGVWVQVHFAYANPMTLKPNLFLVSLSALVLLLCLAASWWTAGKDTVIMIAVFLVFGYVAQYLPAWIGSAPVRLEGYVTYMLFGSSNGLLGQALQIITVSVIVYVLFGTMFEVSGGTRAIAGLALYFARHGRGAAIKVCIIASGVFGMISGSATSNVLTAGTFSIPGMKKVGVPAATAAGIEAVASTCGQIMPPVMGSAAFLMANLTGIPYSQIALASFTPALLCYVVLFLQAERLGQKIEAKRGKTEQFLDEDDFKLGWGQLIHLVPVAGMILVLTQSANRPELAGIVGLALAAVVAVIVRGPAGAWRALVEVLPKAGRTVSNLVVTAATIGVILAVIGSTGLDVQITIFISEIGKTSLLLSLLLTALAAFVLGLGVSTAGVYIVAGALLAPGLVQLGVPEIAAHLFVLYSAMLSFITPPVAFASLAASGLADAGFNETSNEAMKFGWILFLIPFLIAYSPEIALVGEPMQVAMVIAAAAAGVIVMAQPIYGGVSWPWRTPLGWVLLLLGLALILPILPAPIRAGAAAVGLVWVVAKWVLKRRVAA